MTPTKAPSRARKPAATAKTAPRKLAAPRTKKATPTAAPKPRARKVAPRKPAIPLQPFRLLSPFFNRRVRKGQAVDLFVIPEHRLAEYLDGRPRDPRVKYCTHINRSRMYRPAAA